jgi:uncharacterized membrane protein YoaK (UPF0700 family)
VRGPAGGVPEQSPASRPVAGIGGGVVSSVTLLVHSALLSGVAGYVDAAGFVLLVGIFPAHLTGELVSDAIAVAAGQMGARTARLWIFPVFVASVVLAAVVARLLRQRGYKALTGLLVLVTGSLALFSGCDALAHLFHQSQLPILVTGSCAVAAMGFQTALMRESLTGSCPTTVMTGNLAYVVFELVDQLFHRAGKTRLSSAAPRSRLASVSSALIAFTSCAVLGAWLTRAFGSASVILPTLVTAALTVRAWREDRAAPTVPVLEPNPMTEPWFTDDDLWADSEPLQSLSAPYTEPSSATRIKAESVVLPDEEERS